MADLSPDNSSESGNISHEDRGLSGLSGFSAGMDDFIARARAGLELNLHCPSRLMIKGISAPEVAVVLQVLNMPFTEEGVSHIFDVLHLRREVYDIGYLKSAAVSGVNTSVTQHQLISCGDGTLYYHNEIGLSPDVERISWDDQTQSWPFLKIVLRSSSRGEDYADMKLDWDYRSMTEDFAMEDQRWEPLQLIREALENQVIGDSLLKFPRLGSPGAGEDNAVRLDDRTVLSFFPMETVELSEGEIAEEMEKKTETTRQQACSAVWNPVWTGFSGISLSEQRRIFSLMGETAAELEGSGLIDHLAGVAAGTEDFSLVYPERLKSLPGSIVIEREIVSWMEGGQGFLTAEADDDEFLGNEDYRQETEDENRVPYTGSPGEDPERDSYERYTISFSGGNYGIGAVEVRLADFPVQKDGKFAEPERKPVVGALWSADFQRRPESSAAIWNFVRSGAAIFGMEDRFNRMMERDMSKAEVQVVQDLIGDKMLVMQHCLRDMPDENY